MSKAKTIVLIVLLVLITNGAQFGIQYYFRESIESKLNSEIATLSATIEQLGPIETVYSVSGKVTAGAEIMENQIVEMSLPSSMITDAYVMDPSTIIGKVYKVSVDAGTPLTNDMIMERGIDDTTRDVDICMDRWTVGLKVGDYVDYRITLPYGDDYIAIPHLRVEAVNSTSLKVYMTEAQWHIYQGSLVDYYLNSDKGASIYVTKYVEPGVQKPATSYYSVPENIQAIMLLDPNIIDKAEATANSNMRKSIDKLLKQLKGKDYDPESEASFLNAGRTQFNSSINSDASIVQSEEESEDEEVKDLYGEMSVYEDEEVIEEEDTVE